MKPIEPFFVLIMTLLCALPGRAQQIESVATGNLEKAGTLIGMEITDSSSHRIGKVNNLAVDLQIGRVGEILIETGAIAGAGSKIIAVPPQCLEFTHSNPELRLNADSNTVQHAPAFDVAAWKLSASPRNVAEVYRRFNVEGDGVPGYWEPADKIVGLTARNGWNQRLGKVNDLVVELPTGRIVDVIIASTSFLGTKGFLTAVPLQAFIYNPEYRALLLDTTRGALKKTPHFSADDWKMGVNNALDLTAVCDTFAVLHALTADAFAGGTTEVAVAVGANDGDLQNDAAITHEIERKIIAAPGLSVDARHVKVITHKGRVTLRGTADSDKEKRELGEIAASVVPVGHVENRVEIRLFAEANIR